MSYSQKTPLFGIPVIGKGDKIQGSIEMRKYRIIENLLVAGTQGVKSCVFDDGDFTIESETDETCRVFLRATGASPSAHGIVGGAYFRSPPQMCWEGLSKGFRHYLYIRGDNRTFEEPSAVRVVASQRQLDSQNVVLLAEADLRDGIGLELYPDGKLYSSDLARHVQDSQNPHGRKLEQDEIEVRRCLKLHSAGVNAEVEMLVDGEMVAFPAGALPEAMSVISGRKVTVIDFVSGGPTGITVKVDGVGTVSYVSAHRTGRIEGVLGETSVGYFSDAGEATSPDEFIFYNSGDVNILLRAVVLSR